MASQFDTRMRLDDLRAQLSEEEEFRFDMALREKKKDPTTMMLLAAIGFLGVAGIHRFALGQAGMGILYLLTAGLCGVGTIVDMVRMKSTVGEANLATEYEELQLFLSAKASRERRARERDSGSLPAGQ